MRVLICPLNWGLGHATRCIPVINAFIQSGHELHIGGDGDSLTLLQTEFPNLPIHSLASLRIHYGKSFFRSICLQLPKIIYWIFCDRLAIKKLQKQLSFDLILSDSRLGCHHTSTYSLYLCHQLSPVIKPIIFQWLFNKIYWMAINGFDEIWLPDQTPPFDLAGKLGLLPSKKLFPIGLLSRFHNLNLPKIAIKKDKILAILSGPEPVRSDLEKKLFEQLVGFNADIVGGVFNQKKGSTEISGIRYYGYLNIHELYQLILEAEVIICRAGYSTLMDLAFLNKKIILIPTPGQTEQEFLADKLVRMHMAVAQKQDSLDLSKALLMAQTMKPFQILQIENLWAMTYTNLENRVKIKQELIEAKKV